MDAELEIELYKVKQLVAALNSKLDKLLELNFSGRRRRILDIITNAGNEGVQTTVLFTQVSSIMSQATFKEIINSLHMQKKIKPMHGKFFILLGETINDNLA